MTNIFLRKSLTTPSFVTVLKISEEKHSFNWKWYATWDEGEVRNIRSTRPCMVWQAYGTLKVWKIYYYLETSLKLRSMVRITICCLNTTNSTARSILVTYVIVQVNFVIRLYSWTFGCISSEDHVTTFQWWWWKNPNDTFWDDEKTWVASHHKDSRKKEVHQQLVDGEVNPDHFHKGYGFLSVR